MKRHLIYMFASAALFAAGCAQEPAEKGFGKLNFICSTDGEIEIEPKTRTAEVPEADQLSLGIEGGESYNKVWETVAAFRTEDPLIKEGDYTATVGYGDLEIEGPDNPCYFGEKAFTITARETSQVEIVAKLVNAQVIVCATEQFMSYFNDIRLTLTTGSGSVFSFNLDAETYVETPIFVKAATTLTVGGKARHQSPNGSAQGPEITFDDQSLGSASQAATRYTFKFDAPLAGGATLSILLDNELIETRTLDFEINDGAIPDTIS